jgi:DNA (cytosine-5)-methyltransferase 1
MKHGSLFSGIGGFDLAAEWMGWENVFHCEMNEFGRKVLNYYWPKSISHENIITTDFNIYRGRIDIISGGFPCQPYSQAGQRLGKEDDRHLWPEMLRAIQEIQPTWVVGENVLGLVNWSDGLVFEEVQADLESSGYEVQPYVLPAASINAPHRRDRVWFVAHSNGSTDLRGSEGHESASGEERLQERNAVRKPDEPSGVWQSASDTISGKREIWRNIEGVGRFGKQDEANRWNEFPTQFAICSGDDGIPSRLDGITFPKWRRESIKAYGNAIVPQVVYQIFQSIQEYENLTNKTL